MDESGVTCVGPCTSRLTVSCGGDAAMRGVDRIAGVPANGPRARRARSAGYGVAW
jgi:hypothetical protein